MATNIKVGDKVRIKGNYPYDEVTANKHGTEFVVTDVVDAYSFWPGYSEFFVEGDPQGFGVWAEFVEVV